MTERNNSGIYAIEHMASGRSYIGSSSNIGKRWKEHRSLLRKGRHHSKFLQHAWSKYGENAFLFHILEYCEVGVLFERETEWIDGASAFNRNGGFNMTPAGGTQRGRKHTPEARAKIAAAQVGRPPTIHSEATRKKISDSLRGRKTPPETVEKYASKLRGRKQDQAFVLRRTAATRGKVRSEESRERMRVAGRKRYAAAHQIARQAMPVECIETGRVFPSAYRAAMEMNLQQPGVSAVCRGVYSQTGGHTFRYAKAPTA